MRISFLLLKFRVGGRPFTFNSPHLFSLRPDKWASKARQTQHARDIFFPQTTILLPYLLPLSPAHGLPQSRLSGRIPPSIPCLLPHPSPNPRTLCARIFKHALMRRLIHPWLSILLPRRVILSSAAQLARRGWYCVEAAPDASAARSPSPSRTPCQRVRSPSPGMRGGCNLTARPLSLARPH